MDGRLKDQNQGEIYIRHTVLCVRPNDCRQNDSCIRVNLLAHARHLQTKRHPNLLFFLSQSFRNLGFPTRKIKYTEMIGLNLRKPRVYQELILSNNELSVLLILKSLSKPAILNQRGVKRREFNGTADCQGMSPQARTHINSHTYLRNANSDTNHED